MSAVPLAVNIVVICLFTAWMHYRYGNWRKQHILVTLTTFVAWYFPFLIVFLMPIDVSNTVYKQCLKDHEVPVVNSTWTTVAYTLPAIKNSTFGPVSTPLPVTKSLTTAPQIIANGTSCVQPWTYLSDTTLTTLWHVVYWTCQALTWIILPMMQSYSSAGDFTFMGKLKFALLENAIIYGSFSLILTVCVIYVAVKPELHFNRNQLKVLAVTASNTWGLTLLVLLLGHGLVDVPRSYWSNAWQRSRLARAYFSLAKLNLEKTEAEEELEDVFDDVKRNMDSIEHDNPFRLFMDIILLKCPSSLQKALAQKQNQVCAGSSHSPSDIVTRRSLVRLHRRVITATQRYNCTQNQWSKLLNDAMNLEDVVLNEYSRNSLACRITNDSFVTRCYTPAMEWWWHNWLYPLGCGLLGIVMYTMSVMVIWSECLFFVKTPTLSLFGIFVNLAKTTYNYHAIEFVCIFTILYLCICAYCTVFRIRVFNFYYLVGNHHTDENSLIFCGMMLCRLTPPLCLNFLGLIHLDSHITKDTTIQETAFTHIMGHMDVIPFISDGFNIYFPIAILLLCFFSLFNIGKKILHRFGFQLFISNDELTQELIDEGKELVRRERRKYERQGDGETRRKTWGDKYNGRHRSAAAANSSDMRLAVKQTVAGSPTLSDRTELLRNVGPVDYTEEAASDFFLNESAETSLFTTPKTFLHDRPVAASRPQTLPIERRYDRKPNRLKFKGIFDDV